MIKGILHGNRTLTCQKEPLKPLTSIVHVQIKEFHIVSRTKSETLGTL